MVALAAALAPDRAHGDAGHAHGRRRLHDPARAGPAARIPGRAGARDRRAPAAARALDGPALSRRPARGGHAARHGPRGDHEPRAPVPLAVRAPPAPARVAAVHPRVRDPARRASRSPRARPIAAVVAQAGLAAGASLARRHLRVRGGDRVHERAGRRSSRCAGAIRPATAPSRCAGTSRSTAARCPCSRSWAPPAPPRRGSPSSSSRPTPAYAGLAWMLAGVAGYAAYRRRLGLGPDRAAPSARSPQHTGPGIAVALPDHADPGQHRSGRHPGRRRRGRRQPGRRAARVRSCCSRSPRSRSARSSTSRSTDSSAASRRWRRAHARSARPTASASTRPTCAPAIRPSRSSPRPTRRNSQVILLRRGRAAPHAVPPDRLRPGRAPDRGRGDAAGHDHPPGAGARHEAATPDRRPADSHVRRS